MSAWGLDQIMDSGSDCLAAALVVPNCVSDNLRNANSSSVKIKISTGGIWCLVAHRPFIRMTAERHCRTRPECRCFRQRGRMTDGPQRAEAGRDFFDERLHRFALQILGLESIGDAAEIPQPLSGPRQRHPDMPAAAF